MAAARTFLWNSMFEKYGRCKQKVYWGDPFLYEAAKMGNCSGIVGLIAENGYLFG